MSTPPGATPVPYSGPRQVVRDNLGSRHVETTLDHERSGEVEYAFNELGFRGPSWNPDARFTAFVFGESDAFGLGVRFEDAWPVRVAHALAERRGIAADDVCVMDFADSGASNAYIARMVVTQCARVRPDLALVNFAEDRRTELLLDDVPFTAGPWMELPHVDDEVRDAADPALRELLTERVARGRAHLRACDDDQGLYDTLREMLLVQSTLAARGIEAFAVSRRARHYVDDALVEHPVLGPLARALDPWFLVRDSTEDVVGDGWQAEGAHFTVDGHAAVARRVLAHVDAGRPTPPARTRELRDRAIVTDRVRAFYAELPFNYHGSDDAALEAIRRPTIAEHYPDLHQRLTDEAAAGNPAPRILEVGCGAGWLSHQLALHYGARVDAIDITAPALERARALGPRLGTDDRVTFLQRDVFEWQPPDGYDLAVSLGVLHHTRDPRGGLARMVDALRPHGHVYVGLYHAPARRVFLEELWRIAREQGEDAAFERYRELDAAHAHDDTLARSWFRDQVLHPHETQHTLAELWGWFDELGVELASTSINRFGPVKGRRRMAWKERRYRALARRALFVENRYVPGFFTALGRRLA